ncbi:MAG: HEAT repeat protein, partial [Myxococcota bacterium]
PVPEEVALGIRISCWSRWSAPMMMMRLLDHPSAEVRLEAVTAIGLSAGPSLLNAVQPLLTDSDDAVQVAAALAVQRMRGTVPRR